MAQIINPIIYGGGGSMDEPFVRISTTTGSWGPARWTADKDYSLIIAEGRQNNGGQTFKLDIAYSGDENNVLFSNTLVSATVTGDGWEPMKIIKDVKHGETFATGSAVNATLWIYCLESEQA